MSVRIATKISAGAASAVAAGPVATDPVAFVVVAVSAASDDAGATTSMSSEDIVVDGMTSISLFLHSRSTETAEGGVSDEVSTTRIPLSPSRP